MKRRFSTFLCIALLTIKVSAGVYYIDYAGGNDANNGTATNVPWQRCPGMVGFSGTYSHSAGDVFILKGGVIWPTNCLSWVIVNSGSSGSPDIYESSSNWYSGASFTNPIIDCSFSIVTGSGLYSSTHSAIYVDGSYVTLQGIEVRNLLIPADGFPQAGYSIASITTGSSANYINILQCYIHDWLPIDPHGTNDTDMGGIFLQGGGNMVVQCQIGPGRPATGLSGSSGCGIHGGAWGIISNNITGCSQMINGGGDNVSWNFFHDAHDSYCAGFHMNVFYSILSSGETQWVFNNTISNVGDSTGYEVFFMHPGGLSSPSTNTTTYMFNNLFIHSQQEPMQFDDRELVVANPSIFIGIYNNTVVGESGALVVGNNNPTYHFSAVDVRDNFWIMSVTPIIGSPTILTNSFNLQLSSATATSDGYTLANSYQPTSASSPTVGVGTNLTLLGFITNDIVGVARPATGAWDVGAYQYVSNSIPNYTFTVVNGTGSGTYASNSVASYAATVPGGQGFQQWSGPVYNPLAPTGNWTVISNATITASFTNLPTYTLSVTNGSGSGNYTNGAIITITANTIGGFTFTNWTGYTVTSATSATTRLTMPAYNTNVVANYTANPPATNSGKIYINLYHP